MFVTNTMNNNANKTRLIYIQRRAHRGQCARHGQRSYSINHKGFIRRFNFETKTKKSKAARLLALVPSLSYVVHSLPSIDDTKSKLRLGTKLELELDTKSELELDTKSEQPNNENLYSYLMNCVYPSKKEEYIDQYLPEPKSEFGFEPESEFGFEPESGSDFGPYSEMKQDIGTKFSDLIIQKMKEINLSYALRKPNSGLYYTSDYNPSINSESLHGLTPPMFWTNYTTDYVCCVMNENSDVKSSHAISALFAGPSFLECGSALIACMYHALCTIVGANEFNKLFDNKSTRLVITQAPFQPFFINKKREIGGNPLFLLFNKICSNDRTIERLRHGDIVHIRGVDKYKQKHVTGYSQGENVIVIKNESTNFETKFIGFGPKQCKSGFVNGPMTYSELIRYLIDAYNMNQNESTIHQISKLGSKCSDSDLLKNDVVGYDYQNIGHITLGIRPNVQALMELSHERIQKNQQCSDNEFSDYFQDLVNTGYLLWDEKLKLWVSS